MDSIGEFRLKQQIEEDVLGEVYCAAWGGDGADGEEIVLLRLFARDGLDPERFLERIEARRSLVGSDLGAQLTTSRRLGVTDGRAFDLFPWVSGRNLASLIEVTTRQRETFPLEVALFIAERLAIGLGVAFRQEIDGECLTHGFVVPELVRISEEGSVVLGGLEAAPALRDFRGTAATFAQLFPYLPPERRAGEAPHSADDVYSLGALLYRLLTLRPLASPSDLRAESQAIPAELRYLLARSVAERPRRIQSVVEWLRELKALVAQEGWTASERELSTFLAEVDERVRPLKPDTSEITAADREEYVRMIREARAKRAAEAGAAEAPEEPSKVVAAGADEAAVAADADEAIMAADAGEAVVADDAVETVEADEEVAVETASSTGPADAAADEEHPSRGQSYETSVITGEELKPLLDQGRLVKSTLVKRAGRSNASSL